MLKAGGSASGKQSRSLLLLRRLALQGVVVEQLLNKVCKSTEGTIEKHEEANDAWCIAWHHDAVEVQRVRLLEEGLYA